MPLVLHAQGLRLRDLQPVRCACPILLTLFLMNAHTGHTTRWAFFIATHTSRSTASSGPARGQEKLPAPVSFGRPKAQADATVGHWRPCANRTSTMSKLNWLIKLIFVLCVTACAPFAGAKEVQCAFHHPGGAREQIRLAFDGAGHIQAFWWWMAMPDNKNYCTLPADTFHDSGDGRYVGREGCEIMVWKQGTRLTMALSPATAGCRSYCTSSRAYDRMLPIAVQVNGGGCSD